MTAPSVLSRTATTLLVTGLALVVLQGCDALTETVFADTPSLDASAVRTLFVDVGAGDLWLD